VATRWNPDLTADEYDARWARLAADGHDPHGEATFLRRFSPASVLDAGCGTGRVAIELARHRIDAVGVDLDATMLAVARAKAPDLAWLEADLAALSLGRTFDVVALAGNVILFVEADRRAAAVACCAAHLADGGRLVAGFQLGRGVTLDAYDAMAAAAGLHLEARYATWEGAPFTPPGDYAVSVHRRQSASG
jgi:SAM-dependent methyltransferase